MTTLRRLLTPTLVPTLALATGMASLAANAAGASAAAPSEVRQVAARTVATPATAAKPRGESFHVATFNVLGGSHTRGRGKYRSGTARTKDAIRYINKHRASVVGLQEFEKTQWAAFAKQVGNRWRLVGAPSRSGKSLDTRNAVAFKRNRFNLVSHSYLPITYLRGKRVNVPVVHLKARKSGKHFYVVNTHNPADLGRSARKWRSISVKRQMSRITKMRNNGATVLFTGDMNAKAEFFCHATRTRVLHSASGGSVGRPCRTPRANGIDWIMGTRDIDFSRWVSDKSTRSAGVSDHPIVVARARVTR